MTRSARIVGTSTAGQVYEALVEQTCSVCSMHIEVGEWFVRRGLAGRGTSRQPACSRCFPIDPASVQQPLHRKRPPLPLPDQDDRVIQALCLLAWPGVLVIRPDDPGGEILVMSDRDGRPLSAPQHRGDYVDRRTVRLLFREGFVQEADQRMLSLSSWSISERGRQVVLLYGQRHPRALPLWLWSRIIPIRIATEREAQDVAWQPFAATARSQTDILPAYRHGPLGYVLIEPAWQVIHVLSGGAICACKDEISARRVAATLLQSPIDWSFTTFSGTPSEAASAQLVPVLAELKRAGLCLRVATDPDPSCPTR